MSFTLLHNYMCVVCLCVCCSVAGDDYLVVDELVITYSPGESPLPKCLMFSVVDDDILEGDHKFTVIISKVEPSLGTWHTTSTEEEPVYDDIIVNPDGQDDN